MPILILSVIVVVSPFCAEAFAVTNGTTTTIINQFADPTPERIDSLVERVAGLESHNGEMVATLNARMSAVENSHRQKLTNEEKIAERLDKACGNADEFYGKRYGELKAAYDQFLRYMDCFLVCLGVIFALISIGVTWWGIMKPSMKLHEITSEWTGSKKDVEKLKSDALEFIAQARSSKAEQYFQMARLGFAQYKMLRDVNTLEIVVKFLSQCIMHNVGAMNAAGAKSGIAFLNTVMNKHASEDPTLPSEIEKHREAVCENLRTWEWGFGIDELKLVFENSEIDEGYVNLCLNNFKRVLNKCRGE